MPENKDEGIKGDGGPQVSNEHKPKIGDSMRETMDALRQQVDARGMALGAPGMGMAGRIAGTFPDNPPASREVMEIHRALNYLENQEAELRRFCVGVALDIARINQEEHTAEADSIINDAKEIEAYIKNGGSNKEALEDLKNMRGV